MTIPHAERLKLDHGLAHLLTLDYIGRDQTVPVIITAEARHLDAVISLVATHQGRIRHVLRPLDAVAIWLPLRAVHELAPLDIIAEIELDQQVHVA
ncbi:MAG: hypothetical protein H0X65_17120 [Gemmatimonadetes bacterium]|nr:hypothetical protein [Gemmatimonadota bacterium]